jgi:hypothetical protein
MNAAINNDSIVSVGLAMAIAPYDTGNLRFNAIKRVVRTNGFTIQYSLADAFYIYFLEEGTSKSLIHQGFIANRTVPAIANYLFQKYEARNQTQIMRLQKISREAANDIDIDSMKREKRHLGSLGLDVPSIAEKQNWEHSQGIEQYDTDWKRDDFFD